MSGTPQIEHVGFSSVLITVSDGLREAVLEFEIEVLNSSKTNQSHLANIQIFPNPVSDKLFIKSCQFDNPEVVIYNLEGQMLFNKTISKHNAEIDLNFLKTGAYLLKISALDEVRVFKIVKE